MLRRERGSEAEGREKEEEADDRDGRGGGGKGGRKGGKRMTTIAKAIITTTANTISRNMHMCTPMQSSLQTVRVPSLLRAQLFYFVAVLSYFSCTHMSLDGFFPFINS